MTEDCQSKLDFHDILVSVDRKFEIILCKWISDKDFEIRIRTEIEHDNDDFNGLCDEWVDLFSNVTNTIWVKKISNTGPKIRFRKQYQCWTHGTSTVKKELLFDSTRCKGVLDMKVLTDTPLTRRKNKHIRMGLNSVVKINFSHLHPVITDQPFSFFVHNCPPQSEPIPRQLTQQVQQKREQQQRHQIQQLNPIQIQNVATTNHMIQIHPTITSDSNPMSTVQQTQQISLVPVTTAIQGLELSEQLVMCQPTIMFDPTQGIQVQTLQPQMVTVTNAQHLGHIHQSNSHHTYHLQ